MNQRKRPVCSGPLNNNQNSDRLRGELWPRQFRSPEEIAANYQARMLQLLEELRSVGRRRQTCENGGPNK